MRLSEPQAAVRVMLRRFLSIRTPVHRVVDCCVHSSAKSRPLSSNWLDISLTQTRVVFGQSARYDRCFNFETGHDRQRTLFKWAIPCVAKERGASGKIAALRGVQKHDSFHWNQSCDWSKCFIRETIQSDSYKSGWGYPDLASICN